MEWKQNGSSVWLFSAKLISGLWLCEEPVTWPNVPKTNVLYLANKVPVILSVQLVVWVAVCQCVCQRGLARWPLPSGPANQHHAWAEQLQHRKQTTLWSTSLSSLLALSSFSLSLSSSSSFSLSWLLTRSLSTLLTRFDSLHNERKSFTISIWKPTWRTSTSPKVDPHRRLWHRMGTKCFIVEGWRVKMNKYWVLYKYATYVCY